MWKSSQECSTEGWGQWEFQPPDFNPLPCAHETLAFCSASTTGMLGLSVNLIQIELSLREVTWALGPVGLLSVIIGNMLLALHGTASKGTENSIPVELLVQSYLQRQRGWTCSSCPRWQKGLSLGQLGWLLPSYRGRLLLNADWAVASDTTFWCKKKKKSHETLERSASFQL